VEEGLRKCLAAGCKAKAMALTRFCNSHILLDSRQKKVCFFLFEFLPDCCCVMICCIWVNLSCLLGCVLRFSGKIVEFVLVDNVLV